MTKTKWLIGCTRTYYPRVEVFDTKAEALKEFEYYKKTYEGDDNKIFLCKIEEEFGEEQDDE